MEDNKKVNEKANEVRELTDEELAQVTGGGKEKFQRTKPYVNIDTIGHVDYGKVTLTVDINKEAAR